MCGSFAIISMMCLAVSAAAPADNPVRVELPVYEQRLSDSNEITTTNQLSSEPRFGLPIFNIGGSLLIQRVLNNSNLLTNSLPNTSNARLIALNIGNNLFATPVTTLEGAAHEMEGPGSKSLSILENLHHVVADVFHPRPLVDTIREEEKYGNNGDKFYSAGRAVVSLSEGISNHVNAALEVPTTVLKTFARTATDKLNYAGGRIVGIYVK